MYTAAIKCDKTPYMLPEGPHTGSNLRAFFGVEDDKDLWVSGEDGDVRIQEGEVPFFVSDGDRFYTAHKKINQG